MSKSDAFETAFLKLIFQATAITNIADNTATAPLTNLYAALHTADPADAGNQSTSEVSYTGYARVAVSRSAAGFTVVGGSVSPMAAISFGACTTVTGGSTTATYFSIGSTTTGAGTIYYSGSVSPTIAIAAGVTPQLTTATAINED